MAKTKQEVGTVGATLAKRNLNSMDLCKLFMAMCVVAIHTRPMQNCKSDSIFVIYELAVQLAVPFFFFSTGFLLASKFEAQNAAGNMAVVATYLRRTVKLYFLWCLIYFPFSIYYYATYRSGVSLLHVAASYIRCLLCIGGHYNAYQLWYLLSTIYGLLLVMLLLRCKWSEKGWLAVMAAACALSLFMDWIAEYEGALPAALRMVKLLVGYTTVDGRPLWGSFLIPAGMLMTKYRGSVKWNLLLFAFLSCLDFFVENPEISTFLTFLRGAAFFTLVMAVQLKDHRLYPTLRKISTDMYLMHLYVWIIYSALMDGEKRYGFDSFLVTTVVCFAIGWLRHRPGRKLKTMK